LVPFLLGAVLAGAQDPPLQPGQRLEIPLVDFPPCLVEMESGNPAEKVITAVLPEDYTPEGKYPLLIFLQGGNGGLGRNPNDALVLSGKKGFIAVNMPLFKKALNRDTVAIYIHDGDFKHIAQQHVRMLGLLRERIPNIADKGHVGAGFSNGAHTLGAIVDDRVLAKQFSHYILAEGGAEFNKIPREAKAMILIGENSYGKQGLRIDKNGKIRAYPRQFADVAKKRNVTFVVMPGIGHEFPEKYRLEARDWLQEQYPGPGAK
jgi:hypothetical protein